MTHMHRYAQAYIRGTLYAIIAMLTALVAELEVLKTLDHAALVQLTWVHWTLSSSRILLATAITMRAFFDGTMERIKPKLDEPSPASTPTP